MIIFNLIVAIGDTYQKKTKELGLNLSNYSLGLTEQQLSDNLLFTWNSWLKRGGRHDGLVNLGALLRPALSAADLRIDCAIVQLADRTLSPPAQRLVDLILRHAQGAMA